MSLTWLDFVNWLGNFLKMKSSGINSCMHARFYRKGAPLNYHKMSAVCYGIRHVLPSVAADTLWCIGSKSNCSFWHDRWTTSRPSFCRIQIPDHLQQTAQFTIGQLISNGQLLIPEQIQTYLISAGLYDGETVIPMEREKDELIWELSSNGQLTVTDAYHAYHAKECQRKRWLKVWQIHYPASVHVHLALLARQVAH